MSLSPAQIIAAICPDLSGSPSLPVYLAMAADLTERGFFGNMYNYAVAYRACHLFAITGTSESGGGSNPAAGLGQIASMSEGGLSISYAQSNGDSEDAQLSTTKYGKMLDSLIRSRPKMGVNGIGRCI